MVKTYFDSVVSLLVKNCSGLAYSTNERELFEFFSQISDTFDVLLYDEPDFFQDSQNQHIKVSSPDVFKSNAFSSDSLGVVAMYSMMSEDDRRYLNECIEKSTLVFLFLDMGVCYWDGDLWRAVVPDLRLPNNIQFSLNLDTLRISKNLHSILEE